MELLLSIMLGIGLSAAAGFRVFIPLLVISLASKVGFVDLADGASWLSSWPAIVMLSLALIIEIVAFYIPYVDNLLEIIKGPIAILAGIILTSALISDINPMLKWSLSIFVGGSVAGISHNLSYGLRSLTTFLTAGIANNLLTSLDNILSFLVSIFSLLLPIITAIAVIAFLILIYRLIRSKKEKIPNQ